MNRTERGEQAREPSRDARIRDTIALHHGEPPKLKLVEKPPEREKSDREKRLNLALGEVREEKLEEKKEPTKPEPVEVSTEPEEVAETNVVPGLAPSPEQAPTKVQTEALEAEALEKDLDPQASAEGQEGINPEEAANIEQEASQHYRSQAQNSRKAA